MVLREGWVIEYGVPREQGVGRPVVVLFLTCLVGPQSMCKT